MTRQLVSALVGMYVTHMNNVRLGKTHFLFLSLAEEVLKERIQRMLVGGEKYIVAPAITASLFVIQLLIGIRHSVEQTRLVDEGQERDTLPRHFLPIHIDLEGFGVKVDDG